MNNDLISRKAAIDAIRASTSKYKGFMEMEMYTDDDAVKAIEGLPSAQSEPKWISVQDRLPTEKGAYLTAYYDGFVCENEWQFIEETAVGWVNDGEAVRYWMELPDPPNCGKRIEW